MRTTRCGDRWPRAADYRLAAGRTHEARYDVADQTMKGEMDPFSSDEAQELHPARIAAPSSPPSAGAALTTRRRLRSGPGMAALRFSPRRPVRLLVRPDGARHAGGDRHLRLNGRQGFAAGAPAAARCCSSTARGRLDGAGMGASLRPRRTSRSRWLPAPTRSESGSTTSPSATRYPASNWTTCPTRPAVENVMPTSVAGCDRRRDGGSAGRPCASTAVLP